MTDPKTPEESTQKAAEDKPKAQPKATAPKATEKLQKAAPAQDMTREEGRKRVEQLGNSTAVVQYDFWVSNKRSPKEAARLVLKQYGKKNG